jgi:hypothetical protein
MSTKETNALYAMVNVYLPSGTWAGQFINEDAAKSWVKSQGLKLDAVEISRRRPEVKGRGN